MVLETNKEYTILVIGDLTSNGKLELNDLAKIQKVFLEIETIENKIELLDFNEDNSFALNDIALAQKIFLGLINLN